MAAQSDKKKTPPMLAEDGTPLYTLRALDAVESMLGANGKYKESIVKELATSESQVSRSLLVDNKTREQPTRKRNVKNDRRLEPLLEENENQAHSRTEAPVDFSASKTTQTRSEQSSDLQKLASGDGVLRAAPSHMPPPVPRPPAAPSHVPPPVPRPPPPTVRPSKVMREQVAQIGGARAAGTRRFLRRGDGLLAADGLHAPPGKLAQYQPTKLPAEIADRMYEYSQTRRREESMSFTSIFHSGSIAPKGPTVPHRMPSRSLTATHGYIT